MPIEICIMVDFIPIVSNLLNLNFIKTFLKLKIVVFKLCKISIKIFLLIKTKNISAHNYIILIYNIN